MVKVLELVLLVSCLLFVFFQRKRKWGIMVYLMVVVLCAGKKMLNTLILAILKTDAFVVLFYYGKLC